MVPLLLNADLRSVVTFQREEANFASHFGLVAGYLGFHASYGDQGLTDKINSPC